MRLSQREDCLEALYKISSERNRPVGFVELSGELQMSDEEIRSILDELEREGHIARVAGGDIMLTDSGRQRGEGVLRKHRTLECFLTEMLGMNTDKASQEACRLEHDVSDETIDRLSLYIRDSCPGAYRWGKKKEREPSRAGMHSLLDFSEGDELRVVSMRGPGWKRRLMDLGIIPGQTISLKRKLRNQSIVVRVKQCDVALSPEIARSIFVEKRT
ncbi:MAG: metal-dependent transcriptional regulator [Methanomicrobiaceae archaeon]|nr:metal-dependent transcriptional regulator [Methanomicrobiaceae archaeon]